MVVHSVGLARVTVAAPRRRIDLALPEDVAVAEILPGLLAHAGEELADEGVGHGGWVLRRSDGSPLGHTRTLASHRVRDGEVLHLLPRRTEWPELDYDDLVDAIAAGSRRRARRWTRRHTRWTGLAVGAAAVLLGLAAAAASGPDWGPAAKWLLGQAALLLVAGVVLSRRAGDSAAGALVGLLALPYAFAGGGLLEAGSRPLTGLGAPQLLLASALLLCAGLVGYFAVADATWLFAGGAGIGLLGVLGAALATSGPRLPAHQVAAVLIGLLLPFSPAFPSLAIRLGRVPLPALPTSTADLVRDEPQPPRPAVYTAVARADALLTGMLLAAAAVSAACLVLLVRGDSTAGRLLAMLGTVGFLLRARLYPIVRQRVPLLLTGLTGVTAVLLGVAFVPGRQLTVAGSGLVALGSAAVACGLIYSRREPSPYLGRSAEIFELLVILSVLPVACSVLGLYGRLRGLGS